MRDITSGTGGSNFNYSTPMQEAQDRLAPATTNSAPPTATTPTAQAPGRQQRPVAMPSMQAQLLRQWEAGPSNPSPQAGVLGTTSAPLSLAELDRQNQALLAAFRQKADANPDNTPLTKDYLGDVLVELADWLKHQPHHPELRSLSDLTDFVGKEPLDDFNFIRTLERNFTSSGAAPVRMGTPNQKGTFVSSLYFPPDLDRIIKALDRSRSEPSILLPPASTSRQDEQLPHTFQLDLLRQGTIGKARVRNIVRCFKHFTVWLHQQTAHPHGLDSLEKLRDHPGEQEVQEVIARFRNRPDTSQPTGDGAHTAVMKFRKLGQQRPAPATSGLGTQPTLQQLPTQAEQPANPAPPHSPGSSWPIFSGEWPVLSKEELDLIGELFPEEGGGQHGASSSIPPPQAPEAPRLEAQPHGVRRAALGSQDEARAVRPRLDPAWPEQPASPTPPHSPGLN